MEPGCAGTVVVVTARVLAMLVPQAFVAVTEMSPPTVPAVTVMELVVELPVHPAGSVHVYDVAPLTAVMEYVCCAPWQTVALPEIAPG
jgi:hypothetical protein